MDLLFAVIVASLLVAFVVMWFDTSNSIYEADLDPAVRARWRIAMVILPFAAPFVWWSSGSRHRGDRDSH